MQALLEIAVFNLEAAVHAANAGANRIELCENPADGGTTPSYGTLKRVKEHVNIPVFPIIRARGGDFLYTDEEFNCMREDILLCKQLGFEGIVTGALNEDGTINKRMIAALVELAYPMEVTFHRAFDRAADPFKALEDIIDCGCDRLLTSGQVPNVTDALPLVASLVQQANDRIIIMPGSGLRSSNITAIAAQTGATEFHSSARYMRTSAMQYQQTSMQESLTLADVDVAEVKQMRTLLDQLSA